MTLQEPVKPPYPHFLERVDLQGLIGWERSKQRVLLLPDCPLILWSLSVCFSKLRLVDRYFWLIGFSLRWIFLPFFGWLVVFLFFPMKWCSKIHCVSDASVGFLPQEQSVCCRHNSHYYDFHSLLPSYPILKGVRSLGCST